MALAFPWRARALLRGRPDVLLWRLRSRIRHSWRQRWEQRRYRLLALLGLALLALVAVKNVFLVRGLGWRLRLTGLAGTITNIWTSR